MLVKDCEKCPALVKSRTHIVQPYGNLDHPDILFFGKAPEKEDDEQGRPFVGRDGHVLASLISLAGVPKSAIALDNPVRCRPPGNRVPHVDELANCREYMLQDIADIQPRVIVTLGATALNSLYAKVPITSVMGQTLVQPQTGIPLVPTYHPAFLMRDNWGKCGLVAAHIAKAYRLATGKIPKYTEGRYFTVRTLDELREVRDYLLGPSVKSIAFDTETTGLDWTTAELLTLQLSGEPGTDIVIPFLHNVGQPKFKTVKITKKRQAALAKGDEPANEVEQLWVQGGCDGNTVEVQDGEQGKLGLYWALEQFPEVIAIVQEILGSDKPKGAQNAVFDLRMLERDPATEPIVEAGTAFGFEVRNLTYDTMLAAKVVNENIPSNLTLLTSYYTDIPFYEEEINRLSSHKKRMQDVPNEVTWKYGATDVDVLQRIEPILSEQIDQQPGSRWLIDNLQVPAARLVTDLQKRGILVDREYLDKLVTYYDFQQKKHEETAYEIVGREFKYGDWGTLQKLLFDELDLPLTKAKTDGARGCKKCGRAKDEPCREHAATGRVALEELRLRTEHPVLPPIIALKRIVKFKSTYLGGKDGEGGYAQWIRKDGRIHANWGMRTETGRLACQDPNLMNIPVRNVEVDSDDFDIHETSAMKRLFIAPPGCQMMTADWSQLEVWGLAYRTGDQTLLSLLLAGQDVHTYVARMLGRMNISPLFPDVDTELDDPAWQLAHGDIRSRAKPFVFGLSYGLTEEGVAVRLGCSKSEAGLLVDAFLSIFPTLRAYFAEIEEMVTNLPYAVNTWAGRWRHFPEVPVLKQLGYRIELEGAVREAYNMPVQGGGHDLHLAAWIRTEHNEAIMARALPVLETHDSLSFEVEAPSQEYLVQTAHMIKKLWEDTARTIITPQGTPLGWEVPVEITWGPTLGTEEYKLTARGEVKKLEKEVEA